MKTIPFSPPYLNEEDILAVTNVLRSGWITSGSVGEEFASSLTHYNRASNTLLTNSATSALFVALMAMGIGEGDEVITTPYTFAATANVIYHTGAKVIFADLAKDSFYIDPEEIYKKITPKTKAIIPVDFSTAHNLIFDENILAQQFTPSNKFQESLGRTLILSDSAHALGSRFLDSQADMAAYSFHAVKNLTTAEGGALSLSSFKDKDLDQEFHSLLKAYILHGQDRCAREKFALGAWEYDITVPGYKCNMPDTLAALGLSQLKRYESTILPHRRKLMSYYKELLTINNRIIMDEPSIFDRIESSSCHLMPIRIRDYNEEKRNRLIAYCLENGVHTNVHYKPLNMMTVNKYYQYQAPLPNSYAQYSNEISLPIHSGMSLEDVEYVVQILLKGLEL